jgi:hypothetical protein
MVRAAERTRHLNDSATLALRLGRAPPYGNAMTTDAEETEAAPAASEANDKTGWTKPALIGLGGAVASAAIAAAVIYAGRAKRKQVDKLAAAEKTPPTD